MIIIKNIIPYFIQIRHTDDFLSTDTRHVFSSAYTTLIDKELNVSINHSVLKPNRPHIVICRVQPSSSYRDLSCFARAYGRMTKTVAHSTE